MPSTTTAGIGGILPDEVKTILVEPVTKAAVALDPRVTTTLNTGSHATHIPVIRDDASAAWLTEGAEIATSDATFDEVTVVPTKVAGLVICTNEAAADSNPAAVNLLGDSLARNIARKVDEALFGALAAPAPTGLGAVAGVSVVDAGAAFANLDAFDEALSVAEGYGARVSSFVASPASALALATLKDGNGSNRALLGANPTAPTQRTISGVPLIVSEAVGDGVVWAMPTERVMTVLRSDATITVSDDAYFTSDRVAIRGIMRIGFGYPSPKSIVKITVGA